MSETKQQDLTRMLGVWNVRCEKGMVIVQGLQPEAVDPLWGGSVTPARSTWPADGQYLGEGRECGFDLTEKLGDLDHLRRGADVLMQRREYVTAAVVYQLLGAEEGVERAVRERREEIERERQADGDKPF